MRQYLLIITSLLIPALAVAQSNSSKNPTKHCWDDVKTYAESVTCEGEYLNGLKEKVETSFSRARDEAKDWDRAFVASNSPYCCYEETLENSQNAFLKYTKAECLRVENLITNSNLLQTQARVNCEISLYTQRLDRLGTE